MYNIIHHGHNMLGKHQAEEPTPVPPDLAIEHTHGTTENLVPEMSCCFLAISGNVNALHLNVRLSSIVSLVGLSWMTSIDLWQDAIYILLDQKG